MAKCPFCGGQVSRVTITSAAGERDFSTCCGVGYALIETYDDVFAGLPEELQKLALKQSRAELAAIEARERENAERFKSRLEEVA